VAIPLQIDTQLGVLSFLSPVSVFGTALDVTLSELALELFYPADKATGERVRGRGAVRGESECDGESASERLASGRTRGQKLGE
jgi:hypothetical protein